VGSNISDAFYFAVVTFLTIGYGDIYPQSHASKVFLVIYVAVSSVVQLTVLASFVHAAMDNRVKGGMVPEGAGVRLWIAGLH
jgi:voltage-gated potassium channel Kch